MSKLQSLNILSLVLISALITSTTSVGYAKPKDKPAWTNEAFHQMNDLAKDVSKDVKLFFKENPDWVAENFGGSNYDRKEAFRTIKEKINHAFDVGINAIKETLGLPYQPLDGLGNLCTSPRTCLGIQYIVGKSILDHMPQHSDLTFWMGSVDETHNFIVMLPKGIELTNENIQKFAIIFDPYPTQSGEIDEFMHFGFEKEYQGMHLEPLINRDSLELVFGKDPFHPPTPGPTPTPDPVPVPLCTQIYVKDASGSDTDIFANDVMFIYKIQNYLGTAVQVGVLDIIPVCEWYTTDPNQLLSRLSDPYNCIGIARLGAGNKFPDISKVTMSNIGTGYCKSN